MTWPISILWGKKGGSREAVRAFLIMLGFIFFSRVDWTTHGLQLASGTLVCTDRVYVLKGPPLFKCFLRAPYNVDIWAQAGPHGPDSSPGEGHFLRLAPLDTSIKEENTESSTFSSFGLCHITQCASAFKYLCNKVILCLCRVPGFFIITQTFNIWCPSSTGKVKGVC